MTYSLNMMHPQAKYHKPMCKYKKKRSAADKVTCKKKVDSNLEVRGLGRSSWYSNQTFAKGQT